MTAGVSTGGRFMWRHIVLVCIIYATIYVHLNMTLVETLFRYDDPVACDMRTTGIYHIAPVET